MLKESNYFTLKIIVITPLKSTMWKNLSPFLQYDICEIVTKGDLKLKQLGCFVVKT